MKLLSISRSHIALILCVLCITKSYASDPKDIEEQNTHTNPSRCGKVAAKTGLYTFAAACGGCAGFVVSGVVASSLTPQKSFPTPQEYFAQLEIYHQLLSFYSSILVPTVGIAGAVCTAFVDNCRKNNVEPTPSLA